MGEERDSTADRRWLIGIVITLFFGFFGVLMAVLSYMDRNRAEPVAPVPVATGKPAPLAAPKPTPVAPVAPVASVAPVAPVAASAPAAEPSASSGKHKKHKN